MKVSFKVADSWLQTLVCIVLCFGSILSCSSDDDPAEPRPESPPNVDPQTPEGPGPGQQIRLTRKDCLDLSHIFSKEGVEELEKRYQDQKGPNSLTYRFSFTVNDDSTQTSECYFQL
ncbi:hypothetical protein SAMN06296036_11780 [Pseudobacteriovorax antillogorgiicola]|uniref:Uncharacterized protein n=1 Tax=Pseudobacteriovorax antillogorgiicola TaxID=1513793 RepID=A0A1Y6CIW5_9BACT|nr:hypothetical protein EDD56_11779 [Pseudobacteriovorax antillogorgiicola]SMF55128.1 hypothetical protein SAMN06296036_11780 [Pseudobacteriovorax antillogorgiicola]